MLLEEGRLELRNGLCCDVVASSEGIGYGGVPFLLPEIVEYE